LYAVVEQVKLSDGDLIEEHVDSKGRIVLEAVTTQPRISAKMATAPDEVRRPAARLRFRTWPLI